jgi:hypothetical protein
LLNTDSLAASAPEETALQSLLIIITDRPQEIIDSFSCGVLPETKHLAIMINIQRFNR